MDQLLRHLHADSLVLRRHLPILALQTLIFLPDFFILLQQLIDEIQLLGILLLKFFCLALHVHLLQLLTISCC
jgi:hypothetical protein